MGIRTTVTFDEDVLDRVKRQSRVQGVPFRQMLNDLLRTALLAKPPRSKRKKFRVQPIHMGYRHGLPYDDVAALIEYAEGTEHR
jgi:hypothetical protein